MEYLERHHLRLLCEVERHGSLTAASKRLGLTQSALSHAIKRMEHLLETQLWRKEGRRVRLTPAGQYLLAFAKRVLPQFTHTEHVLRQLAKGQHGTLRLGVECHPCYRWLLRVVEPYLRAWPDVDLDLRQRFQFGGVGALFGHEIDMLVTPDPLRRRGLHFEPIFSYEQVLVVSSEHRLASRSYIVPSDLEDETLITYPVEAERLDVFSQFLLPAGTMPREHKTIETTEIMLQMVACERGIAALPNWLVAEYRKKATIVPVRLGKSGVHKQIFLGLRTADKESPFIADFIQLARNKRPDIAD